MKNLIWIKNKPYFIFSWSSSFTIHKFNLTGLITCICAENKLPQFGTNVILLPKDSWQIMMENEYTEILMTINTVLSLTGFFTTKWWYKYINIVKHRTSFTRGKRKSSHTDWMDIYRVLYLGLYKIMKNIKTSDKTAPFDIFLRIPRGKYTKWIEYTKVQYRIYIEYIYIVSPCKSYKASSASVSVICNVLKGKYWHVRVYVELRQYDNSRVRCHSSNTFHWLHYVNCNSISHLIY